MMIKILKPFVKYSVGQLVNVADEDGIPTDIYWRKRLRDGDIDLVNKPVTVEDIAETFDIPVESITPTPTPKKSRKKAEDE